jgi:acetyltransferase-like isoleucine patch superfamily enzyme
MILKSLNNLRRLRLVLVAIKRLYLRKFWGMDLHPTTEMSLSAKFDKTHPSGIHVGARTYIAFEARILAHDMTRNIKVDTRIGQDCFIGGRSLILPGISIGDQCIVAAGSVVTKSVPSNTVVAGNPAKVIHENVRLLSYGRFDPAAETKETAPV